MKKPSIPLTNNQATPVWVSVLTEIVDIVTGRKGKLSKVDPDTVTVAELARAHNALLDRLQE